MPNSHPEAPLRVLVVDDEPLARDRLRAALAAEPGVEVVGECPDGLEAVRAIGRLRPDLVLLDVQMPGLDGFGVIREVGAAAMPPVIFVTAWDDYAVQAFEVQALDYLLKPFDDDRLRAALARARDPGREAGALAAQLRRLLEQHSAGGTVPPGGTAYAQRLLVRRGAAIRYVPLAEVEWIEAADNYVRLHGSSGTHLVRMTLRELEGRLDPAEFARVHRSAIVRLAAIREIRPWAGGDYLAVLQSGREVRISRTHRERVIRTVL